MAIIDLIRGRYRRADINDNHQECDGVKDENKTKNFFKSAWIDFRIKINIVFPLLWPKNDPWMKARVMVCFLLILSIRGLNCLVSRLNKGIVDVLTEGTFPWVLILALAGVKFLQGGTGAGRGGGFVNSLKNILWIKVEQSTSKQIRLKLFNHLHRLGVRWHQAMNTGVVLKLMDRRTSSITTLLNTAFFKIIQIIIDVGIAITYLSLDLNFNFRLIIFITVILYMAIGHCRHWWSV